MERMLFPEYGEVTSRRFLASHQNTPSAFGCTVWAQMQERDKKGEFAAQRILNYFDMRGVDDLNTTYQPHGYQSFVSSRKPYPKWNSCTNYKRNMVCFTHDEITNRWNSPQTVYFVTGGRQVRIYPHSIDFRDESYLRGLMPPDTMFASSRAWNTMQPRFESDANIMLSIMEAQELKDLSSLLKPSRFESLANEFLQVSQKLKIPKLVKMAPKFVLSDMTRVAAESWLAVMLAIMPTLSDLHNIFDAIENGYQAALDRFAQNGVDGTTRYYSENLHLNSTLVPGRYNNSHYLNGTHETVKFTAAMNFGYQYNIKSKFEAIKRYYGLGGGFATLWERVPLSFLIDYVFTIGKALKAMERDPNVADLTVYNYSESLLSTYESGNFMDQTSIRVVCPILNGKFIPVDERKSTQLLAGSTSSLYTRVLTQPVKGTYIPRFKKPSGKQAATALALVRLFM